MKESRTPILEARKLSFRFADGDRALFSDVNLKIEEGDRLAVLGPTGVGKSVLLKLLAGLLPPTSGEVLFQGLPIAKMKSKQLRAFRRALGMTFQKDGLFDSLTCGDNLRLPLWEVERVMGRDADKRVDAALASVELAGQAGLKVFEMSGGMQKRLGIARALLFRPSLVLYDEPTAGLDPITSRNILALLGKDQQGTQTTMAIVSSQPVQIESVTESAVFLWDGELEAPRRWAEWKKQKGSVVAQFLKGSLEGPLTDSLDGPKDKASGKSRGRS